MAVDADTLKTAMNKAKIALMGSKDSVFLTTVCFSLKHLWDETIPTACTDGKYIKFNPDFFMGLKKEERLFLLLHETLHVAFLHMLRLSDRNPKKWNMAADYVINDVLKKRNFQMPEGGLYNSDYTGMSTEQVYDLLPDAPVDFDMDLEPGDGEASDKQQEQAIQDILVRAAVLSQMAQEDIGDLPGEIQIYLEKLTKPKMPWHRILARYLSNFVKADYSFRKPNRRFFPDHILPSQHTEALTEIAVAIDTSGSVTDEEFLDFMSEVSGIMKQLNPKKLTLLQFDTSIRAEDHLSSAKDIQDVVFKGRGGTAIQPVMDWAIEHKPTLLLVFTDGYFHSATEYPGCPLIWVIHGNDSFNCSHGKIIPYLLNQGT